MRYPQVLIYAQDDWLTKQLADLASENRWLLKHVQQIPACRALVRLPRPTVLLAQVDPSSDHLIGILEFLAELHWLYPFVSTVVVSDVKMNEEDRVSWTATAFHTGARFVLYPPLTRPILEDLVKGLMNAQLEWAGRTADGDQRRGAESVIDLADEGMVE